MEKKKTRYLPALVSWHWEKLCLWSWVSRPRAQFFPIRTCQPANNIHIFTVFVWNENETPYTLSKFIWYLYIALPEKNTVLPCNSFSLLVVSSPSFLFLCVYVCLFCVPDLKMQNIFSFNWLPGIFNSKLFQVAKTPIIFALIYNCKFFFSFNSGEK